MLRRGLPLPRARPARNRLLHQRRLLAASKAPSQRCCIAAIYRSQQPSPALKAMNQGCFPTLPSPNKARLVSDTTQGSSGEQRPCLVCAASALQHSHQPGFQCSLTLPSDKPYSEQQSGACRPRSLTPPSAEKTRGIQAILKT